MLVQVLQVLPRGWGPLHRGERAGKSLPRGEPCEGHVPRGVHGISCLCLHLILTCCFKSNKQLLSLARSVARASFLRVC